MDVNRICVGSIEIAVRPGYMWIENGRVTDEQLPDLREALAQAQAVLRGQR